jgi:hypothetical protein
VANFEGDNLDFSDLKLPGIEALEEQPESADEVAAEPIKPEVEQTAKKEEEAVETESTKEPSKQAVYIEWGVAIGVPVLLLAVAWLGLFYISTAIYLIAVGFVPYGIWKGRETSNVYTIVLGCALIAMMTLAYFMWVELGRYNFDVKAREGKNRISMSQTIPDQSQMIPDQQSILRS